jgi:hypothetical protein
MKKCIVNVGIDHWYGKGTERLRESLKDNFDGDLIFFNNQLPPGARTHKESNYGFKIHAIQHCIDLGYELIFWLDSSMYAVKPVDRIFEITKERGYYFINNGFNAAQTLTDNALKNLELTRDEAEKINEVASGFFGLNMRNKKARTFFEQWKYHESVGSFNGSRTHNPSDSTDPRFLFSRHEQSVASVLLHRLKMNKLSNWGEEGDYWAQHKENNHSLILCRGM